MNLPPSLIPSSRNFTRWVSWLTVILCSNTAAPVPTGGLWEISAANTGIGLILDKYTYLLRCIPAPGDNNFYCYAYVSDLLNSHMEKAAQGIRFIDSRYKELFRLPDGGNIIITHTDGEKIKAYCRYIDETHAEIGKNTYHICEFAQHMEDCGATYAPAEPLIPEMCYSTLPSSGEVIKVFRGDRSYIPLKMPIDSATARKYADDMNRRLGVSKAQEAAMLAGSMFGWSVPAADAKNYDENGNPRRPKSKDRGDAR